MNLGGPGAPLDNLFYGSPNRVSREYGVSRNTTLKKNYVQQAQTRQQQQ